MSDTLTAAREAERAAHEAAAAATKHREQVEKEEQERLTVTSGSIKWRLASNGKHFEWSENGHDFNEGVDVPHIALLASLLPRKPVAISDEMVRKALAAYFDRTMATEEAMRAALSAVASDLSAPVAVAAPTLGEPQWWGVLTSTGKLFAGFSKAHAEEFASERNGNGHNKPYRVVGLVEVPDETEGAAND